MLKLIHPERRIKYKIVKTTGDIALFKKFPDGTTTERLVDSEDANKCVKALLSNGYIIDFTD